MNRGGAETMIMNIYRKIDRSKVQFDFVVHTEEKCDFNDEIILLGGLIYHIPRYNGKNHFHYKKSWNEFFKKHNQYKVIHGHVRSTASIYLKIAKKHGLTTIAHSHSTSSGDGLSALVKNLLQYPIRNIADYLFACSRSAGEWLFGKEACKKDNFFVVKNAIDAKKFAFNQATREKIRGELQVSNKFVVGHVGRFNSSKNHEFLVDIFESICSVNKNAILMLIGSGEMRISVEKKVSQLGLINKVIFTGTRTDIPDLLQAMDVFVFPSLYEGLGIAVVEAQASGLPCVISDKIPQEAFITSLINVMSLNVSSKEWAREILNYSTNKRKNTYNQIASGGYDIPETATFLCDFYCRIESENLF
jgi:glycosyltransferase involved in cell wall biosynthesis